MDPFNGARAYAWVEQRAVASALRPANAAYITTLGILHRLQDLFNNKHVKIRTVEKKRL